MASFFGSILLFLLFVVGFMLFMGLALLSRMLGGVRNLWNLFTGKGYSSSKRRQTSNKQYHSEGIFTDNGKQSTRSEDQGHRPHSSGVFKEDEGTYVDFEEIKDN